MWLSFMFTLLQKYSLVSSINVLIHFSSQTCSFAVDFFAKTKPSTNEGVVSERN